MTDKKPHKHAELIKAWADGAEIELFDKNEQLWIVIDTPSWNENVEFRIKPEPKPVIIEYYRIRKELGRPGFIDVIRIISLKTALHHNTGDIRIVFDGDTGIPIDAIVLKEPE